MLALCKHSHTLAPQLTKSRGRVRCTNENGKSVYLLFSFSVSLALLLLLLDCLLENATQFLLGVQVASRDETRWYRLFNGQRESSSSSEKTFSNAAHGHESTMPMNWQKKAHGSRCTRLLVFFASRVSCFVHVSSHAHKTKMLNIPVTSHVAFLWLLQTNKK